MKKFAYKLCFIDKLPEEYFKTAKTKSSEEYALKNSFV